MFKITRGAITITCETPEELQDAVDAFRRGVGERPSVAEVVARSLGGIPDKNPWTPRVFSDFVQAIGSSQTTVLAWAGPAHAGDRCHVTPGRRCGVE